eukprot:gene13282-16198_t
MSALIKVLYVEDEPFLAQIVSDGLRSSGYEVILSHDGQEALRCYINEQPDICILDIMLPMKDGYSLATDIRKINSAVPIIFLSAKNTTEDVVKGFKSGGHDYLKKPFSIEELLVRMDSLLQRAVRVEDQQLKDKQTVYAFGNCQLDMIRQVLKTTAGEYAISFKEAALLEILLLHKNQVLERAVILLKIWGDDSYYNTRSMDVFLTHLRKLLRDEPGLQIMNIRGIGYKLVSA